MRSRLIVVVLLLFATHSVSANESPVASGPSSAPAEQQRLLQQKCAELDQLQAEIKKLRDATGTPQQILVKIQMLEVGLTKMRDHGISTEWFSNNNLMSHAEIQKVFDSARAYTQSETDDSQAENSTDGLQFVNWLREQNLAKPLADPNIVVISGKPASLHIGGEFPVPDTNESKTSVGFRQFGTQLNVEALAVGDNRVRLDVKARVSELDDSYAIDMNGVRVPGLRVRECNTGSELSFGESIMLTGLVQRRVEAIERADGQVVENAVDVGLIVVITPELIQPANEPVAKVSHAVQGEAYR